MLANEEDDFDERVAGSGSSRYPQQLTGPYE